MASSDVRADQIRGPDAGLGEGGVVPHQAGGGDELLAAFPWSLALDAVERR